MTDRPDEQQPAAAAADAGPVDGAAEVEHDHPESHDGGHAPEFDHGPEDEQPEHAAQHPEEHLDEPATGPGEVRTGHPAVDEVLRSLDGLDGRPVDEHVAAFERAHEELRRALSDAGDDTR